MAWPQWLFYSAAEFKKLVYESKFTKPAEQMSFVNCQQSAGMLLGKEILGLCRTLYCVRTFAPISSHPFIVFMQKSI
jgi:hypothetical protein